MKPMNEEQKFFKLLKYSNELKKNKKSLDEEDPEAFDMLLHFSVDFPLDRLQIHLIQGAQVDRNL